MIHDRIPVLSTFHTTSLLLCHECFSWNQPLDGRCPECHHTVDSSVPDPTFDVLGTAIGELTGRVGPVCVRRRTLPDRGTLYATTNGLFFLPHSLERRRRQEADDPLHVSVFWSVASTVWSPLAMVLPLLRVRRAIPIVEPVLQPRILSAHESHLLPELLMQNPGVFFVGRRTIRNIGRWGNRWKITRSHARPVRLRPEHDRHRFHARMTELVTSRTWQESLPG